MNFRLTRDQAWKFAHIAMNGVGREVVVNGDSQDKETKAFTFAIKVHPEASEQIWRYLNTNDKGWSFFEMDAKGECRQLEREEYPS